MESMLCFALLCFALLCFAFQSCRANDLSEHEGPPLAVKVGFGGRCHQNVEDNGFIVKAIFSNSSTLARTRTSVPLFKKSSRPS